MAFWYVARDIIWSNISCILALSWNPSLIKLLFISCFTSMCLPLLQEIFFFQFHGLIAIQYWGGFICYISVSWVSWKTLWDMSLLSPLLSLYGTLTAFRHLLGPEKNSFWLMWIFYSADERLDNWFNIIFLPYFDECTIQKKKQKLAVWIELPIIALCTCYDHLTCIVFISQDDPAFLMTLFLRVSQYNGKYNETIDFRNEVTSFISTWTTYKEYKILVWRLFGMNFWSENIIDCTSLTFL